MNVLFLAPGFPGEMPLFVRGLSSFGARVYGIADHPASALPPLSRAHLSGYLQAPSLREEDALVEAAVRWAGEIGNVEKVFCQWEPGVIAAARIRERLGLPGLSVEDAIKFRDKDVMKKVIGDAGIRVPKHRAASTVAEVREAAEEIGYPLIIKPIDGAGSMDTFRVDDAKQLEEAIARTGHVMRVNIEEFIDGEEFTFDTVCANGEMLFFNIGYYRPRPLVARSVEWISPQTLCLRDVDDPRLVGGNRMGADVLKAMNFQTGFTHMEWYLTSKGETVFGEIAARPAGARTVDLMNFVSDIDLFTGWAEAELRGTFSQVVERKYSTVNVFKRAQGQGIIRHISGLDRVLQHCGDAVVHVDLLQPGEHRRDWILTLISDGYITLRHPDFGTLCELADYVGTELQLYAS